LPGTSGPRAPTSPKQGLWGPLAGVAALHVLGWGLLLLAVPHHYAVGTGVLGVGLGVTAYTLGMRHAFDADHIAAIDNTTRKLLEDGNHRPASIGFWFSLGHSSVVFVMVLGISLGVRALADGVSDQSSTLQRLSGVWGTTVSGLFLLLIGLANLLVLRGIIRLLRGLRRGHLDQTALHQHLHVQGALARILQPVTRTVRKPWHMYPVGFLFGLGFDTVTEIGLLVIAGGAVAASLPWWAVLTLPLLFAAGMSLLDTLDGAFMTTAYEWAFDRPIRKIYYNLTVTSLSVAIALGIGGIELVGLLADQLGIQHGPLAAIATLNLERVGYAVVAAFLVTWAVSLAVWRWGNIEERWTAPR
jgi:high-affinity nickel-transport protein